MAHNSKHKQLVFTIKDRCRVCYTCVRECPVKAIRIVGGQAIVISERCIGCGNCVRVCSQGAKVYLQLKEEVMELLQSGKPTAACIAPSFPAEFIELDDHRQLVGMVHALGFDMITEVGFGADMVSVAYRKNFQAMKSSATITSDCPAIVYYVEHYHPDLVPYLAPFVSPMVALSRYLKHKYGDDLQVVFIGPCIAKKAETDDIDLVITFTELRDLFELQGITADNTLAREFDPPYSGKGAAFSISHGLLQNMDVEHDLTSGDVIVAEGRENFKDAVHEFAQGKLNVRHLELLCCEGCITGPGMSIESSKYLRRSCVSSYVAKKMENLDSELWQQQMREAEGIDLSNSFEPLDRRLERPSTEKISEVLIKMGKTEP
ncbi:MAG: 4Fe-4S binding protein, partial [Bacteroidales bacterium]|nr:4Fe-4S binding protein [Bacteroidales bacterium]